MQKNQDRYRDLIHKESTHPIFRQKLTFEQRTADTMTKFGGSWGFITLFVVIMFFWICMNTWLLLERPFDPYPFILLNLTLSCLAALQAPIILMSQNREGERDRIHAHYDYMVNRKQNEKFKSC